MAISDFQTVMRPVLQSVGAGESRSLADVRDIVKDVFGLTDEEKRVRLPSGHQTVINNRTGWARTYLNKAGLLTIPQRGMVQITERGLDVSENGPERISVAWLKQFPEFKEFQTQKSGVVGAGAIEQPEITEVSNETPDEQLAAPHLSLMESLADEVLETVRSASPSFFEKLVVDLMISMCYGGSRKEAGQATQTTNDDGIDGIIKEDKLGLDTIYLQAKRWANTVHRPEIDKFIGALTRQRAKKGVFLTTSDFSTGAREAAAGLDMKVVLLDGRELAQLMIENNLGVNVKEVFEVKQVDTDYFIED